MREYYGMITFFVNKTGSYVELIEHRLADLTDTEIPYNSACEAPGKRLLAPIIWESYYADIGLERDARKVVTIFTVPIICIGTGPSS